MATLLSPPKITSFQILALNRVGSLRFIGLFNSVAIPANAQATTKAIIGSGDLTAKVNMVTIASTMAFDKTAIANKNCCEDFAASACTLMFTTLAAMIQPNCKENGARNKTYSKAVMRNPSVLPAIAKRLPRMLSMKIKDKVICSCANATVQAICIMHKLHHQGDTFITNMLCRKDGKNCARTNTASHMNIGPHILKAQPEGVTRVWYLLLSSVFVPP
mmetsp:Transcript_14978/g.24482  ORF Transcript_14978/g.24482 Transcript_14978/m.24482 type:complete len:218 (-) Transcript_14978:265-918(-)